MYEPISIGNVMFICLQTEKNKNTSFTFVYLNNPHCQRSLMLTKKGGVFQQSVKSILNNGSLDTIFFNYIYSTSLSDI